MVYLLGIALMGKLFQTKKVASQVQDADRSARRVSSLLMIWQRPTEEKMLQGVDQVSDSCDN